MLVKAPEELERRTLSIEDENQNFVFFVFLRPTRKMKKSRNTVPVCAGLFYDAFVVCNRFILDDMRSTSCTLKDIAEFPGD